MENTLIKLKELRENASDYIAQVQKGKTFIVLRRSKPVFKISPPDESPDFWETAVDFTKIKRGGILLKSLLSRL
jgi:antitoxin (DNA-binding transcriptional repressor) of toxin-antitoxin stability system